VVGTDPNAERLAGKPTTISDRTLLNRHNTVVVVPTYNGVRHVDDAISSVLAASEAYAYKLLLVDDCSSDGTYDHLVARYGDFPRVEIWKNPRNLGECANTNQIAERVRTMGYSWFVIIHQDDLVDEDLFAVLNEEASRCEVSLIGTACNYVLDGEVSAFLAGTRTGLQAHDAEPGGLGVTVSSGLGALASAFRRNVWPSVSGSAVNVHDFLSVSGFSTAFDFGIDTYFAYKLLESGRALAIIDRPYVVKRVHDESAWRRGVDAGKHVVASLWMMERYRGVLDAAYVRETHVRFAKSAVLEALRAVAARRIVEAARQVVLSGTILRSWLRHALALPFLQSKRIRTLMARDQAPAVGAEAGRPLQLNPVPG